MKHWRWRWWLRVAHWQAVLAVAAAGWASFKCIGSVREQCIASAIEDLHVRALCRRIGRAAELRIDRHGVAAPVGLQAVAGVLQHADTDLALQRGAVPYQ